MAFLRCKQNLVKQRRYILFCSNRTYMQWQPDKVQLSSKMKVQTEIRLADTVKSQQIVTWEEFSGLVRQRRVFDASQLRLFCGRTSPCSEKWDSSVRMTFSFVVDNISYVPAPMKQNLVFSLYLPVITGKMLYFIPLQIQNFVQNTAYRRFLNRRYSPSFTVTLLSVDADSSLAANSSLTLYTSWTWLAYFHHILYHKRSPLINNSDISHSWASNSRGKGLVVISE